MYKRQVLELADEFLLLGVHADHRLACLPVFSGLFVEIAELGVTVGVLAALQCLGVGLEAEAFLPQQVGDSVGTDLVPGPRQLAREGAGRLHRPPQRRHRIPALVRLDQRQQGRAQSRVEIHDPLTPTARPPDPPPPPALADRRLTHCGGPRNGPDAAVPQDPGLRGHQQPPLPFVQVREQHRKPHSKLIASHVRDAHTTPTSHGTRSNTLILCKPLGRPGRALVLLAWHIRHGLQSWQTSRMSTSSKDSGL